jgi:hypothetical protein
MFTLSELQRTGKEAHVGCFRVLFRSSLGGLRKTTDNLSEYKRCLGRISNRTPPEYKVLSHESTCSTMNDYIERSKCPWMLQENSGGSIVYFYPCCFDFPRCTSVGEVAFVEGVPVDKSCSAWKLGTSHRSALTAHWLDIDMNDSQVILSRTALIARRVDCTN